MQVITGFRSTRTPLVLAIVSTVVAVAFPLRAQLGHSSSLPENAVVIERTRIPAKLHADRALLLWMVSPVTHDRGELADETYMCPEVTLGSYYSGPTRLSLLDTRSGRVINTIKLMSPMADGVDEFNIPYRILSGEYYLVPGVPKGREGRPSLLKLRDLNGDGIAAETGFFEAESCMGLPTTLIGFSVAQDKVIQYPAEIEVSDFEQNMTGYRLGPRRHRGKPRLETQLWIDYLLAEKPVQPRHWKYAIDYRGRAGCLDSYDLRYDPVRERFVGTLTKVCPPPDEEQPAGP